MRFWLVAVTFALGVATADTAIAQTGPGFCPGLKQAVAQIPASFAELRGVRNPSPPSGPDEPARGTVYASTLTLDGATRCQVSVGPPLDGFTPATFVCNWRDAAPARARAEAVYAAVQACLGGDASQDYDVQPTARLEAFDASIVRPGLLMMLMVAPDSALLTISSQANPLAMARMHQRRQ